MRIRSKKLWKEFKFHEIVALSNKKLYPQDKHKKKKCIELEHIEKRTGRLLRYAELNGQLSTKNVFKPGDVLFGKLRPNLRKYIYCNFDGVCSSEIWVLSAKEGVYPKFLYYMIQQEKFIQFACITSGSKMPRSNWDVVSDISFFMPPINEQKAIADTLQLWDTAIEKTEALIAAKERQFGWLATRLINKSGHRKKQLCDFIEEVSKRNQSSEIDRVLSVTNHSGFVLPEDQFERRVASANVTNYKIVKQGQYAYNPSRINVGSIARLDDWINGVLSPMYIVFKLNETVVDSDYFLHWLSSGEAKQRIKKSVQGSVRETVSFDDLGVIPIYLPDFSVQKRIAHTLNTAQQEINFLKKLAYQYRTQKRGLMQKLLSGEWHIKNKEGNMSNLIEKIDSIKNMAVFQDFQWQLSVSDESKEFKDINILYGHNGSGKTTLSRIFRALETGFISDKYRESEFKLSFKNEDFATQDSLDSHGQVIRVFNEDFVRDNLHFIIDEEHPINAFAILGEDNTKLKDDIKKHEVALGSEEDKSGLLGEFLDNEEKFKKAKNDYESKVSDLDQKLRDKARKIKNDRNFGKITYNIQSIKDDINHITNGTYQKLTHEKKDECRTLLKEESKEEIPESQPFNLQYSELASKAKELIQKRIQVSAPIQELLNDSALEMWVREGRGHHQEKRDTCAFCGSDLPKDLWEKLDKHFNHESEELRRELESLLELIEREQSQVPNLLKITKSDFYSRFTIDLDSLAENLSTQSTSYSEELGFIKDKVKKRRDDIFTPLEFVASESIENDLNAVRDSFEQLRKKSNELTTSLKAEQLKAHDVLRFDEVYTFINDIKYDDECKAIAALKECMEIVEEGKNIVKRKVDEEREKIAELKAQLKDESKGAEQVNNYLNNVLGHSSLSLKAIKENDGDESSGYQFEITRNDKKAFNLSGGECSLIAFCYFMAKLEDVETKGTKPIIWIDDPVSSLDSNHTFFVYSLIDAEIVKQKNFLQLFISTHNLDFLKYLKKIYDNKDKKKIYDNKDKKTISECFVVERSGDTSQIRLMPGYLKKYITEFNYLFHQIYKCSKDSSIVDSNYHEFYNFGNNLRKFLEIYLYYKYPNDGNSKEKLLKFFGKEDIPALCTSRVSNEYSHLCGSFERGASPLENPVLEMKKVAQLIVSKIKENDSDQYDALLQSIGVKNKEETTQ